MKTDLHAGQMNGTLPILYVFLARSGKTIRNVSLITLDATGAVHSANENPGNATRGVRIVFAGSDGVERTLYYFSTDLSNSGVRSSGFLQFCATLAPGNSLIKSASYLLHAGNFATVRDFLLANSATIIQDDSGIPLGRLRSEKMAVVAVRPLCRSDRQIPGNVPAEICRTVPQEPADDFGIGYRWRSFETNLLLAITVALTRLIRPHRRTPWIWAATRSWLHAPLRRVDAAPAAEPPRQVPSRARRPVSGTLSMPEVPQG